MSIIKYIKEDIDRINTFFLVFDTKDTPKYQRYLISALKNNPEIIFYEENMKDI